MSAGKLKYTLIVRHPETDVPTALLEGKPVPDWAWDLVHEDDLVGGTKPAKSDDDTEAKGYAGQTVKELKKLIAARNEGRDEDGPVPLVSDEGNKPNLVDALELDDAITAKSYGDLTVEVLEDLIARRNEGREEDDLISDEGETDDLVAALVADDAVDDE